MTASFASRLGAWSMAWCLPGALGLVLTLADTTRAAEFRIDGQTVYLDGDIKAGDENAFAQVLASSADLKRLSISSPGGDLATGLRIGEMVRKHGMTTAVEGGVREAASAAAYIFMSGVEREIKGARGVGVHAFYTPQQELRKMIKQKSGEELLRTLNEFERRTQEGTVAVVEFVTRMVGDTRILTAAVKTGSDAMVWPEAKVLKEWKVATRLVELSPEEIPDPDWAFAEVVATLAEWFDPTREEALDDRAREGLDHYLSDDAQQARLREDVERYLTRMAPANRDLARQRVIAPLVDSIVKQLRAASERQAAQEAAAEAARDAAADGG